MKIASTVRTPALRSYTVRLKEGEKLGNMDFLMKEGAVVSYSQEGDKVILFATEQKVTERLPLTTAPKFNLKEKVVGFLKPEEMERDCSSEYATWRKWNLAASTLNGVIGFMATSVFLDAQNASYSNSEAVALSGVVTGTLGKVAQMAGSPLARLGDSDPKKSYLRSHLISTATNSAALGVLGALPGCHFPVFCATSVAGTVGNTIGAAAGANIFSHLVPGPTKGDVTNKNANQELIASLWGMPVGFALSRVARAVGLPPGVLGACLLGPLKAYCHIQAARALKMNPAGTRELGQIADSYIAGGGPKEAPVDSLGQTLKGVFTRRDPLSEARWPFTDSLQEAVGEDSAFTLGTFAGEKYVLSLNKDGKVSLGLARGAKSEDALRAVLHYELLKRALNSRLPQAIRELGRPNVNRDLVRLTKRAVPEAYDAQSEVARSGWHLSLKNLGLPVLAGEWKGAGQGVSTSLISMEVMGRLMSEEPPSEELQKLLQDMRDRTPA